MNFETMTIKEICESHGYTIEEWNKAVEMLISKGVPNGVYQDYGLLMIILERLTYHS